VRRHTASCCLYFEAHVAGCWNTQHQQQLVTQTSNIWTGIASADTPRPASTDTYSSTCTCTTSPALQQAHHSSLLSKTHRCVCSDARLKPLLAHNTATAMPPHLRGEGERPSVQRHPKRSKSARDAQSTFQRRPSILKPSAVQVWQRSQDNVNESMCGSGKPRLHDW
jgi:hypothetical protein